MLGDKQRAEVMVLPRREGDTDARLAARMVLLASAGKRVSVVGENDPFGDFCRYMLAWSDSRPSRIPGQYTRPVFWGKIDGRQITGYNGERVAAEVLREYHRLAIVELVPSSRAA